MSQPGQPDPAAGTPGGSGAPEANPGAGTPGWTGAPEAGPAWTTQPPYAAPTGAQPSAPPPYAPVGGAVPPYAPVAGAMPPYAGAMPPAPPPYAPVWVVPGPLPKPSALPVVPRQYHEFFRAPRFRWWKPILALAMFIALCFLGALVLPGIALVFDVAAGRVSMDDLSSGDPAKVAAAVSTPLGFTANNLALALAIPFAGLTAWAVYGQRPRWMSSIAGRFRWGLLGRFLLVAVPVFLLSLGVEVALGGTLEFTWNNDSLFLIFAVLLTTPFQAAGEEYGVRGIIARSLGSWFGSRRLGLVVAAVLSSLVFMMLHGADNIWLNIYYFSVGMICSVLVWRTGGLEAAVALHIANNMVSEINLPFGGLAGMFDRGPESAGPEILFQLIFTLTVMGVMLWIARRRGLATSAAPAAPLVGEPNGGGEVEWMSSHTTLDKGVR